MRIGHGYDVHRLVPERKLILGGVDIPHYYGLLGHSDADVLTHAVMDALLGAGGLGDIGLHFPDQDSRYAGISSISLLDSVMDMLRDKGWRVVNLDVTVVAQRPKLREHIPSIRQNLSAHLGVPISDVNVKATTEEGLGMTGQEEAMAAHAVVLICPVSPE